MKSGLSEQKRRPKLFDLNLRPTHFVLQSFKSNDESLTCDEGHLGHKLGLSFHMTTFRDHFKRRNLQSNNTKERLKIDTTINNCQTQSLSVNIVEQQWASGLRI